MRDTRTEFAPRPLRGGRYEDRRLRTLAMDVSSLFVLLARVRWGLAFLAVFAVVAVLAHMWVTGDGVLDSLYFLVVTVSTVGYSESSDAPPQVKLLNMGTILIGVTVVGYTISLIVRTMVEGEIRQALGLERMTREIRELAGHTIICGYGRIGQTLAAELMLRAKEFVIVDHDPDVVADAQNDGLLVVAGEAADEDTLGEAGIERASTLIVALQSDADNVFLTLTARNMNPGLRIIARGEQKATEKKLRQAGADVVVLPAVIGARRIAAMITRPHAAAMLEHFSDHENLDADLEELTLLETSSLVGKTVRDTAPRQRHRLLVVGIRRADGEQLFNPDPDCDFRTGDTLIVMGKRQDIEAFSQEHGCRGA